LQNAGCGNENIDGTKRGLDACDRCEQLVFL
jgi:hypothetical protein